MFSPKTLGFRYPIFVCRSCKSQWRRNHSTTAQGGLQGLKSKLQRKSGNDLHELPKTPARTRFAPSPTGYLHLGSLRTALYNWLLARATGGQFILRVEDTDQTRIVEDSLSRLMSDLKWAELNWDEGPDVGGPYGPYTQSKRLHHYTAHAQSLIDSGRAYRCFCTAEDLERHKQQSLDAGGNSVNYPGTCRAVPPDQAAHRAANGESHVVRFRSVQGRRPSFTDIVYGPYQKNEDEDDFILVKTDGFPTYHFANVVDDHLMEVTHVVRGVEWLISTPKHVALYDAFGWTPPTFAHASLLCGPDGEKLSKRNRSIDIDIADYRSMGVMPSALNNWLALLGWSPSAEKGNVTKSDVFPTMDRLTEKFTLKFTKGNAQTNPEKLPIFQRAHQSHLIRDSSTSNARLIDLLVTPLLEDIQGADNARLGLSTTGEATKSSSLPDNLTALERLAPELDPTTAVKATRERHLLHLLKTLAADPKETAIDPPALLTQHPTLFFRPALDPGNCSVAARLFLSSFLDTPGADDVARDITDRLGALAAEVEVGDPDAETDRGWNPANIQKCISDALTAAAKDQKLRSAVYAWLRLMLTGDAERAAKPAKLHLAVLGRAEAIVRLAGYEELVKSIRG